MMTDYYESDTASDTNEQIKTQKSNRIETAIALGHDHNNICLEASLAMLFLHFTGYFAADSTTDKALNHPTTWAAFSISLVTNIILNLALEIREAKQDHKINTERLAFLVAISLASGGTACSLTKLAKESAFLFSAAFLVGLVGFGKINIDTINNASKFDEQGRAIYRPYTRLLLNLIRPTMNTLLQFMAFLAPVLGFGVASEAIPEACFMGAAISFIRVGLACMDIADHIFGLATATNLSTTMINKLTQNRFNFLGSKSATDNAEEKESLLDPENAAVNDDQIQPE